MVAAEEAAEMLSENQKSWQIGEQKEAGTSWGCAVTLSFIVYIPLFPVSLLPALIWLW